MAIRRFFLVFGVSLSLATSAIAPATRAAATLTNGSELQTSEVLVAQSMPRRLLRAPLRIMTSISPALLLASLSLAGGAFIALTWLHVYQQQRRWQRMELARQEVKAFRERPAVKNVLDILDYEEYRTFYVNHPEDGRPISFEATDYRLRRALRSHDQMVKMRNGLDEIKRLASQNNAIAPKTLDLVQQYDNQEFIIEVTLRDWFDSFLGGLEYFEIMIESGLVMAEEIKPFIIHWIRLIGDRRYRRKGGSGFYDKLSHYIHWAGYGRVQKLFERFGFKILPPPYSTHDFSGIETDDSKYDTYRALCLAKAAHLVYEDRDYVTDISRLWLSDDIDNRWKQLNARRYVVEVIKDWLQEGEKTSIRDIRDNFMYLDMRLTDTQAFLFRRDNNLILVFKGTQQLTDWKTNLKIRLKEFTVLADQEAVPPTGRVHRGFLDAWQSVEKQVVYYLRKWRTPETKLWVTGHSLGGALAAVATISLETQGFEVSGLYTFGQPRVADWKLVNYMNARMGDRIVRYVNNNDIVPIIPPQIIPWVPTRVYGHMGQFRYFNDSGSLRRQSFMFQRFPDRLFGMIRAIVTSGTPDAVDDHKMEFYVANLQKALNREEEEAKLEIERGQISGDFVEGMKERMRARRSSPEG
ncbi:lipase family protein [Leptolyngbya sp. CCNP1308]|uniref:lipase family protein n=1 Tax=Leptolyngbya sp. CCNP1308 TaxID=3110255 RepID=UPI002B1F9A3D|nr:lipase family protein [Leptolyngbya sp. CCNP1308]MEA5449745.1 lipase family protein [Leptolyngbya sp. CCNP1308]